MRTIGRRLAGARVIRSEWMFRWRVRTTGTATRLKPGAYEIPAGESLDAVIRRLVRGVDQTRRVVIPEGWTYRQIAALLAKEGICPESDFLRAVRMRPADSGLPVAAQRFSLEGYLMPDTYSLVPRTPASRVVRTLTGNWLRKVWDSQKPELERAPGPDKRVIIASLIEREARVAREQPLIAAVIWNRLARRMKLQIDATVLYALGEHRPRVLFRDLEVESPYNTYRIDGLPPGPICNPGSAALQAVSRPARVDYLYYVARKDGSHVFSRNAEEHDAAVALTRAERAGRL